MLFDALRRFQKATYARADRLARGRYWWLRVALVGGLLSCLVTAPSFQYGPENVLAALRLQIEAPLARRDYSPQTHEAKRALRLTMPTLAHVLRLRLGHLFAIQFAGGFLLLGVAALLTEKLCRDRVAAVLMVVALAFAPPGTACFTDEVGYFDGVAYLLLLLAMWSRAVPLVGLCALLAAFTDERAAVATGFVFLWWLRHFLFGEGRPARHDLFRAAAAVVAVVAWGAMRLWLAERYGLRTPVAGGGYVVGFDMWLRYYQFVPLGLLSGLEGLWAVLVASAWVLVHRRRRLGGALFGGLVVVQSLV
ncbi:MAG: hypothetical protein WBA12_10890, partial [Catalinimonas sp.]